MLPKERQLAALARKPTDRISIDVLIVENADRIQTHLGLNNEAEVLDHLGVDGRFAVPIFTGELLENLDEWGTSALHDYSAIRAYPLSAGIDKYTPPDPDMYSFIETAKWAEGISKKYAIRGPYWLPFFSRICSLYGMEEALIKMYTEPDEFEKVTEMVFEHLYRYVDNYLCAMGDNIDILNLGDDVASQRDMMFAPELWRKFFKDRWARIFELGIKRGKYIWFHSCGNIFDILPDLIDIGVNVWETVQLHTLPISAKELKRGYGKDLIFFGGINTQSLPYKTPEEVADEVQETIQILYADGEGYICGPDHHIKYDVSVENTLALFETAKRMVIT